MPVVGRRQKEMAGRAANGNSSIISWRTLSSCRYNIKLALILSLILTETVAVPLKDRQRNNLHLFPDPNQSAFVSSLSDYEISHPHRVSPDGAFLSHTVHHRVRRDTSAAHWPKSSELHSTENDQINYKLTIDSNDLHLNVQPNHRLLAPGFVIEHKKYNYGNVSDSVITPYTDDLCHFVGNIKDHPGSSVAIGTCYGLHGLLRTQNEDYFIEPIKGHKTSSNQPHPHLVYKRSAIPAHLDINSHESHAQHHMKCGVHGNKKVEEERVAWENLRQKREAESEEDQHDSVHSSSHHRSKRSISLERYVETMIVVDDKMYEHYKDDDLRNYVLTIMNMVTTMYHESTIGNDINIVLVRLVMGKIEIEKFVEENDLTLKKAETQLEITHHAEKTLSSFCQWQKEINPPKDHPNHHDVAVLLTRYNICSKRNAPCSTLGLSHVSGMCQPHRSCNVNEDTGLALAYTVAHELGHNFGMQHDNPGTSCAAEPGKQLIMSPVLNGASPLVWSNCSKEAVTKFLDRDWGYCLNNEPEKPDFKFPIRPPGIMYNADHQCKLQYGSTAKHCQGIDNLCKTLWCKVDNKCLTRLEAAAEGTMCDTNKWCFGGNCVLISDTTPEAIHGEWGSWGSWTGCSRTCGSGVSLAERHCDNPHPSNGGKYCLGERKRYRICNTDSCSEEAPNFRSAQCSDFNTVPYRGKLYTWEPVTTYDNSCQLHCKPKGEFFSVMMKDMVADGTACKIGRRDMCISGKCRTIGCDWTIDSDAKEDSCGVCHGDGTTCKTVKSEFIEKNGQGYVEAMVIPEGARNIRVEEVAEANNYLAVANDKGQYYLNGYWFIQWSGDYDAAGTVLHYTRDGNQEKFFAPGPLKEALHIMLLFQSQNPGVVFEYTVPNENATERRIPEFYWKYLPWTHCTLSCGGGYQVRSVVCVEREAGIVDDFYCNISSKPYDMERVCNDHLCPARWWAGPWQHCSVSCGDNGIHHRTVMCVRSHGQSEQQALDDYECEAQEKPARIEPCHHKDPCPDESYWEAEQWSDCMGTCGKGIQRRNITCQGLQKCQPELRPISQKVCYLKPCVNSKSVDLDSVDITEKSKKKYNHNDYNKYYQGDDPAVVVGGDANGDTNPSAANSDSENINKNQNNADPSQSHAAEVGQTGWSSHSRANNIGHAAGVSQNGVEDGANEDSEDPEDAAFKWVPMGWKSCLKTCGNSTRSRRIICIETAWLEEVDDAYCTSMPKPSEQQECSLDPCLDWVVADWGGCSVTCGKGIQLREVHCPAPDKCDESQKPLSQQACAPAECITWITGPWNECSKSCGGGEQYRHLQCVNQVTQQSADGCDESVKPYTRQTCNTEACPQQAEEVQQEKTYQDKCTGDSMSRTVCKALKKMGQCKQRYVQIKCCESCHNEIAQTANKNRGLTS